MQEWDVEHPRSIRPEDLLYFVYLDEFLDDWETLYPNDEDEISLWALEILIMSNPTNGDVISGTGGLRKLRFGKEGGGKRGGTRICYAYFPEYCVVLMVMAYGKNKTDNLSDSQKSGVKRYLEMIEAWLRSHSSEEGV